MRIAVQEQKNQNNFLSQSPQGSQRTEKNIEKGVMGVRLAILEFYLDFFAENNRILARRDSVLGNFYSDDMGL
jgi:hypothetical protein